VNALAVVVSRSSFFFYSLRMSCAKHTPMPDKSLSTTIFQFSAFNVRQPPSPLRSRNLLSENGFCELFSSIRSFTQFSPDEASLVMGIECMEWLF